MKNKKISSRRWLLLPMEIKVREFEARVLLACIAADQGYGVLLGRNGFNLDGRYPKGVYMDKCISPNKLENFKQQVNVLGNKLASLDVEGLVYQTQEKWLTIRISRQTVDLSSLIFTWGEAQNKMIDDAFKVPEKLAITGSPSADLWHKNMRFLYRDRVSEILQRFGDFIFIPSNFATVINANGADFIVKQFIKNKFVKTKEEINLLHESMKFHQKVFDKFIEMIPEVAKQNKDINIVLRPHPGDCNQTWKNLSKEWPENVHVLYEGNVTPWILAAKMVVHNSCSTAVEAFAMEKPAIAYTPYLDDRFDQNIPNPLSQQAKTINRVLDLVEQNLEQNSLGRETYKVKLYKSHIKSNDDVFSGESIVNALDDLVLPEAPFTFTYDFKRKLRITARKIRRRLHDFTGKNAFSYSYRLQKNPGISLDEVNYLVNSFQENLDRWSDIKVEQVEEDLFCFYR